MKAKATADTLATRLMLYGKDIAHGSDCPAPHAARAVEQVLTAPSHSEPILALAPEGKFGGSRTARSALTC
jgi:hypothetical protein